MGLGGAFGRNGEVMGGIHGCDFSKGFFLVGGLWAFVLVLFVSYFI